jgi:F0F1-type ATP synthase assembly protein I
MSNAKPPGNTNAILRYSGMAVQMGVTIGGGVWLGKWLDQRMATSKPWFTLALALFAVLIAMYNVIRDLNRLKSK